MISSLLDAVVGVLVFVGAINAIGLCHQSWRWGKLFRIRQRVRGWSMRRPASRPIRSLRFWLGVRLLRPRLDSMYVRFTKAHDDDPDDDYALHHLFAVHRLRNWREAIEETPDR